jgi:hypothetical protein
MLFHGLKSGFLARFLHFWILGKSGGDLGKWSHGKNFTSDELDTKAWLWHSHLHKAYACVEALLCHSHSYILGVNKYLTKAWLWHPHLHKAYACVEALLWHSHFPCLCINGYVTKPWSLHSLIF